MSRKRTSAGKIEREKRRFEQRLAKKRRKPLPETVERARRERVKIRGDCLRKENGQDARWTLSVQKSDQDRGDNAQRDEDQECDAHANREAVGKRGLTGWDSHEPREPLVEFHSMSSFRIRRTLRRARICWMRRPFSSDDSLVNGSLSSPVMTQV
jgi:hypothetical protein